MSEPGLRWSDFTDDELEQALHELGRGVEYPLAPNLAGRVRRQLELEGAPRIHPTPLYRRGALWLGAAIVLLAIGISLILFPDVRTAIADRLGLRGVVIRWEDAPPQGSPVGARLMLGRPVTLAGAASIVDFPILVPRLAGFDQPAEVYLLGKGGSIMVSFIYPARDGLPPAAAGDIGALLTQFEGELERNLIEKGLHAANEDEATELVSVSIGGQPGFWLGGGPHTFLIVCPDRGECREEPYRLAGNVLLWQQNGLTLRLESALSRDEAIAVAASVGPAE
jgi:hypothetical protein